MTEGTPPTTAAEPDSRDADADADLALSVLRRS
jgi:hypothetical protein